MNTDRKVNVKSVVNYGVAFTIPELRYKRTFSKENEIKSIDFAILEEALSSNGARTLFEEGILVIENEQDRIDLGLQEEGDNPLKFEIFSSEKIKEILATYSESELADIFSELPREQIYRFAEIAILNKFTDYNKCLLIKKSCGIDVITNVQNGTEDI